jgi:hypothetical protein
MSIKAIKIGTKTNKILLAFHGTFQYVGAPTDGNYLNFGRSSLGMLKANFSVWYLTSDRGWWQSRPNSPDVFAVASLLKSSQAAELYGIGFSGGGTFLQIAHHYLPFKKVVLVAASLPRIIPNLRKEPLSTLVIQGMKDRTPVKRQYKEIAGKMRRYGETEIWTEPNLKHDWPTYRNRDIERWLLH